MLCCHVELDQVHKILTETDANDVGGAGAALAKPRVYGVEMQDGTVIEAGAILSGCSPYHTFLELMPDGAGTCGRASYAKDHATHCQESLSNPCNGSL